MKKLSTVLTMLAIILTNLMCIVVTYNCTLLYYAPGQSAPWDTGLLFIIPFSVLIIPCALGAYFAKKKGK